MNLNEHWRLRLQELLRHSGMNQAAFAALVDVPADYLSRLLYPPEKAGRKNLGLVTIRKISTAFSLPPGWFDGELGSGLPAHHNSFLRNVDEQRSILRAEETATIYNATPSKVAAWPFHIVTLERIERVRKHFSQRGMPDAITEIDKHLDILVTRWENEISTQNSSAA